MSKSNISYRDFYTYSLVKSLYKKGKSYVDIFSPFVINTIHNKTFTLGLLSEAIKIKFGLNIPCLALQVILKKLKKQDFLTYGDEYNGIKLTEKGKKGVYDYKDDNTQVLSNLEGLFDSISLYLNNKLGIYFERSEIYKLLEKIINHNFVFFIEYFNPSIKKDFGAKKIHGINNDIVKSNICEFIINELNNKTKNYEVIKEITYGALLSSVLSNDTLINDIESSYNFNKLNVYLDSNIILSLLGGHGDEKKKSNIELIDLMKKRGINIKIFNFTSDEVISVIKGYFNESNKYISGYNVDSIYQNFKNNGYNDGKIYKLIAEFELIIQNDYGIIIDNNINIKKLDINEEEYEIKELNLKDKYSKEHDIYAIESIKYYRKGISPRHIELSKYIFLSYDKKLFYADCQINNKSLSDKIPNIIPPEYFANYLWLKKPDWDNNLPLALIFSSVHSNGLIDKDIWNYFNKVISEMSEKGNITKEDFLHLIASNEFKNQLVEIDNIEVINEKFIIKNISDTKKQLEEKTYQKLKIELDDNYKLELENSKKVSSQHFIDNIKKVRDKDSKLYSILTIFILIFFYFLIAYLIYLNYIDYFTVKRSEYEGRFTLLGRVFGPILGFIPFTSLFGYKIIKDKIFIKLTEKDIKNYLGE